MAYDRWDWHAGGDFPDELPEENGATHIGIFLAWAIQRGLAGELHVADSADDVARIKARELTGAEFLMDMCDGKFTIEDLDDQGNEFAESYYAAMYFDDYMEAVDAASLESIYHVENSWENFDKVAAVLDQRFAEWNAGTSTFAVPAPKRPWWKFWSA